MATRRVFSSFPRKKFSPGKKIKEKRERKEKKKKEKEKRKKNFSTGKEILDNDDRKGGKQLNF